MALTNTDKNDILYQIGLGGEISQGINKNIIMNIDKKFCSLIDNSSQDKKRKT